MSIATLRAPATIYREEQYFAWWLYALLGLMAGLGWYSLLWRNQATGPAVLAGAPPRLELPIALLVGLVLPPALVVGVLRMTTEVGPGVCRVWYGLVPTYRRSVPIDQVRRVEVVSYRPIRDHGFWGVRTTRDGERVMTARGDRAVRLHLADGSRVLIGSQRPEILAESLDRAIRPVA